MYRVAKKLANIDKLSNLSLSKSGENY